MKKIILKTILAITLSVFCVTIFAAQNVEVKVTNNVTKNPQQLDNDFVFLKFNHLHDIGEYAAPGQSTPSFHITAAKYSRLIGVGIDRSFYTYYYSKNNRVKRRHGIVCTFIKPQTPENVSELVVILNQPAPEINPGTKANPWNYAEMQRYAKKGGSDNGNGWRCYKAPVQLPHGPYC